MKINLTTRISLTSLVWLTAEARSLAAQMGDTFLIDGGTPELPVHSVQISAFFMGKFEVSRERWLDVSSWAIENGYSFGNSSSFKAVTHPVHTINWWDVVKWCNARSEKDTVAP